MLPLPERAATPSILADLREDAPHQVGKYLVSPLVRAVENGWFASSVSIRSGSGTATTDRVLRLASLFRCADQAACSARDEALRWIAAAHRPWAA